MCLKKSTNFHLGFPPGSLISKEAMFLSFKNYSHIFSQTLDLYPWFLKDPFNKHKHKQTKNKGPFVSYEAKELTK